MSSLGEGQQPVMGETTIEKILEEKTGAVILSLTQPNAWDAPGVVQRLQEQINGYISVIQSGALVQRFPQYQGRSVKIRIVFYSDLPEHTHRELDEVNHTLARLGIGFPLMQIKVETERRNRLKEGIMSLFKRLRGKDPND